MLQAALVLAPSARRPLAQTVQIGDRALICIAVTIRNREGWSYTVNYLGWLLQAGWTFQVSRNMVVKIIDEIAHVELDTKVVGITGKASLLVRYQCYTLPVHVQNLVEIVSPACPIEDRKQSEVMAV